MQLPSLCSFPDVGQNGFLHNGQLDCRVPRWVSGFAIIIMTQKHTPISSNCVACVTLRWIEIGITYMYIYMYIGPMVNIARPRPVKIIEVPFFQPDPGHNFISKSICSYISVVIPLLSRSESRILVNRPM